MSCCTLGAEAILSLSSPGNEDEEALLASRIVSDGIRQTELSVPGIHCGGCMQVVEASLAGLPGVESARVNLSTRSVTIRWQDNRQPPPFVQALKRIGYDAHLHDHHADESDLTRTSLVRALAVAGFAASNI